MNTAKSIAQSVGQTPLVKVPSLSRITGCEIWAKLESLNPGGSIKDRTALGIILDAEKRGLLKSGGKIVEGTAGNTGIGLATLAAERGYKVIVSMPDNQSLEKYELLKALGTELRLTPACPFSDERHFYHQAKRISEQEGIFWADQFENPANGEFHFATTGPEIWEQMTGKIDYVTLASGTGGTISGVSRFLKSRNKDIKIILLDPYGSGLKNYFDHGELKSQGSSITEGIGIMRLTANFKRALVDEAISVSDEKMLSMFFHLAHQDGMVVGTSSALNLWGAFELGMRNKNSGKRIVTFVCDLGARYFSRLLNQEYLSQKNLVVRDILKLL